VVRSPSPVLSYAQFLSVLRYQLDDIFSELLLMYTIIIYRILPIMPDEQFALDWNPFPDDRFGGEYPVASPNDRIDINTGKRYTIIGGKLVEVGSSVNTIQDESNKTRARICRTCQREYAQTELPKRRGDAGRCPRCIHRKKQQRMPRGRFRKPYGRGFLTYTDSKQPYGSGFLTYYS